MAAVPCPITRMRTIDPDASLATISAGKIDSSNDARNTPSFSAIFPRKVLRKLEGASAISFDKKCLCAPRSMSRVVTSAVMMCD
ncbi:unannotated protein [freshwater metagenome]|uniref:Unannotated protein n=1 Tax=freshwater metagenome TaxID=449393 RepID=A0A6J6Q0Z7_9ZZZZ